MAAKLKVYASDPKEYYTFITPEAYDALESYVKDFRKELLGEKMIQRWKNSDLMNS
jgi:hypothetical protein